MFNLEKKERLIILSLIVLLVFGIFLRSCHKVSPVVNVKENSFTPDSETVWQPSRININEADEKMLESLDGIGKAMAGRIIEYRNKFGSFGSIDELKKVKGIGDKLFEKIKDEVSVD